MVEYRNDGYFNQPMTQGVINENEPPLTFDMLAEMMRNVQPVPFVALTVTPSFYGAIREILHNKEIEWANENPKASRLRQVGITPSFNMLHGIPVITVSRQQRLFIKWDDKKEMEAYLDRMNETAKSGNSTNSTADGRIHQMEEFKRNFLPKTNK